MSDELKNNLGFSVDNSAYSVYFSI